MQMMLQEEGIISSAKGGAKFALEIGRGAGGSE